MVVVAGECEDTAGPVIATTGNPQRKAQFYNMRGSYTPPTGLYLRHATRSHGRVRVTTRLHTYRCTAFLTEIPEGFSCDGGSVPLLLRPVLEFFDRGGIHERACYFHDYNYRLQPCSKAVCDAEFYQQLQEDFAAAGCSWFVRRVVPWVLWKAVEWGGRKAWKDNGEKLTDFLKERQPSLSRSKQNEKVLDTIR